MEEQKKERNKGGRPTKEIKRQFKVGFNLTETEKAEIQAKAEVSGLKVADYLRDLAIKGKIRRVLTDEELKVFKDLSGMANNLNQLTKEAHKNDITTLVPVILSTLNQINKYIKNLDSKDESR